MTSELLGNKPEIVSSASVEVGEVNGCTKECAHSLASLGQKDFV